LTLEPPITPIFEFDEKWDTTPASPEDFERLAGDLPPTARVRLWWAARLRRPHV
jgi:hypothetical protein